MEYMTEHPCEKCIYYSYGKVKVNKTVYSGLENAMVTISGMDYKHICGKEPSQIFITNRLTPCSSIKEKE